MYELRVVALSEDARYVVLAPVLEGRRERYRVAVDDRLRSALRGELGRLERRIRPDSALTPREIQARVRAGETAETIAAAAGVAVEWVLRFETPVLAERAQVARQARHASLSVSGGEWTGVPLEEIVAARLEADGNRPDVADWDAWRRDDGRWVLQLRVGTFTAHWLWDPALARLVVHDDAARSLLHADGPSVGAAARVAEPRRLALAPSPQAPGDATEPSVPPDTVVDLARAVDLTTTVDLTANMDEPGAVDEPEPGNVADPVDLEPEVLVELRSEAAADAGDALASVEPGALEPAPAAEPAPDERNVAAGTDALSAAGPPVNLTADGTLDPTAGPATDLALDPAASVRVNETPEPAAEPTRGGRRSGRRKSVPSWEDILLGTGADPASGTGSGAGAH